MHLFWIKSEFKFCDSCEFACTIFGNTQKVVCFASAFYSFLDSTPLQEICSHITTNVSIAGRSTIIVDGCSSKIGKYTSCVEYSIFFCYEKSACIVFFEGFDEMLVVSERVMRKTIPFRGLIEDIVESLQIGFITIYIGSFDPFCNNSPLLCEADIVASFFCEARKEDLFTCFEVQNSRYWLYKSTKWSSTL